MQHSLRPARVLLLASLALVLPLDGCALLAGAGVGYVVSREVLPGAVHEAELADDVDRVWPAAQETAEILHDSGTAVVAESSPRRVRFELNGAEVVLEVEAVDLDRTLVRVSAQKYLGADSSTADEVLDDLVARLAR